MNLLTYIKIENIIDIEVFMLITSAIKTYYFMNKYYKGKMYMEDEEELIENTELVEYTDESIDDELEMEGVEE